MQHLAPGTIVKFKGNPLGYLNPYAIVVEHEPGGAVFLKTEGSDRTCVARHEISAVRKPPAAPLRFLRQRMPYGKWTCSDGREVLFNRDYNPIWERQANGQVQPANSSERIPFKHQEWFYDDTSQPWRSKESAHKCHRVLAEWNTPTL